MQTWHAKNKISRTPSILAALLLCALSASAAPKLPPETRNAALRYWMAFAEMQDPPAGMETSQLLEKTAAGQVPWDEAKLGPVLDKNADAIQIMQRATRLPDCDWGLEYRRGPAASIAYAPRARVLARLNTLYGMRLASKGETQSAVDAWLAGIRFSQDLAKGGTLIFVLIAKTALLSNLNALTQAAQQGILSSAEKAQVASVVRALPETGFDWSRALALEQGAIEIAVEKIGKSANPAQDYRQLTGKSAPFDGTKLSASDAAAFAILMSSAEEALRLTPDQSAVRLPVLQKSISALNPFYQELTPSLTKVNDTRQEIASERQKLMGLLSNK
jgi:hypothetical protein